MQMKGKVKEETIFKIEKIYVDKSKAILNEPEKVFVANNGAYTIGMTQSAYDTARFALIYNSEEGFTVKEYMKFFKIKSKKEAVSRLAKDIDILWKAHIIYKSPCPLCSNPEDDENGLTEERISHVIQGSMISRDGKKFGISLTDAFCEMIERLEIERVLQCR